VDARHKAGHDELPNSLETPWHAKSLTNNPVINKRCATLARTGGLAILLPDPI